MSKTEKQCTGCADCSPDNCYDIAPRMSCLKGWRDSLHVRPAKYQEIWVCNGDGGAVAPVQYLGPEFSSYHGLLGALPELRDDHYYWMPRSPGTPPATKKAPPPRVKFVDVEQDRWVDSRVGLPDVGDVVWIDDLVIGPQVARFEDITRPPGPITGPQRFEAYSPIFRSMDGSYKYVDHRYWAPITSPKRPFV